MKPGPPFSQPGQGGALPHMDAGFPRFVPGRASGKEMPCAC